VVIDSHLSPLQIQRLNQLCQKAQPLFGRMVTIFYNAPLDQLSPDPESTPPGIELSQREMEVLSYVARGWTNTEIAEALSLSKNTIGFHLKNIFEKLNVTNRTEAAMWYFESRSSLT
jgi:DNA-binding NarL/FixJ family response regulator